MLLSVTVMAAGIQLYAPLMWLKILANTDIVINAALKTLRAICLGVAAMAAGVQLYAPLVWTKLLADADIVINAAIKGLTAIQLGVASMAAGVQLYGPLMWLKLLDITAKAINSAHRLLAVADHHFKSSARSVGSATCQKYCWVADWVVKQSIEIQCDSKAVFDEFCTLIADSTSRAVQWVVQHFMHSISAFSAVLSGFIQTFLSTAPSVAISTAGSMRDVYTQSSCVALALWVTAGALVPEWIYHYILKLLLPSVVVVGGVALYMVLNWAAVLGCGVPASSRKVESVPSCCTAVLGLPFASHDLCTKQIMSTNLANAQLQTSVRVVYFHADRAMTLVNWMTVHYTIMCCLMLVYCRSNIVHCSE